MLAWLAARSKGMTLTTVIEAIVQAVSLPHYL
jgi:hypothetical protein